MSDSIQNYISQIETEEGIFYFYDESAFHKLEDLGLSAILSFQGTKNTDADILAITQASKGHVYLSKSTKTEFVCIENINGTANANAWEPLGGTFDAASSTHKHTVNISGTNKKSTVTGTISVDKVESDKKYLTASTQITQTPSRKKVLSEDVKFKVEGGTATTTKISVNLSNTEIGSDGTAQVIKGFGQHSKDTVIKTLKQESIDVVDEIESVNVPVITAADETVTHISELNSGTAASFNAEVKNVTDENGKTVSALVLTWTPNTPTSITKTDKTIPKISFTNTTASKITKKSATVVTGSSATAEVLTGLGEAQKETVLTGVKVTKQPTATIVSGGTGDVEVVSGHTPVSISVEEGIIEVLDGLTLAPSTTLTENNTNVTGSVRYISNIEVKSEDRTITNGQAEAQEWSATVTVSPPIDEE